MFRAEESITRLLWIVFGNRSQSGLVLIARAPLQTLAEEDLRKNSTGWSERSETRTEKTSLCTKNSLSGNPSSKFGF
jgi:hypothetical protein